MGKALPEDLRWRAVLKVWYDGKYFAETASDLSAGVDMKVSAAWVRAMSNLFDETGDVKSHQGVRPGGAGPPNRIMDTTADRALIDQLLDSPEFQLVEHHARFTTETGIDIHISTFCKAVRRLGFTRQRLQQYALKRDADAAAQFWATVQHHGFTADMILAVDETSKDKRVLRRSFGYALRGAPPIGASGLEPRGERISALCSFDVDGFVAWQYTGGTHNRETWSEAAEDVILQHVAPQGPGGPRSVVLLDNASIHRSRRFVHACNMRGATVLFTTPCAPACPRPRAPHHAPRPDRSSARPPARYCWDQTPLDNGAFGAVVRWLQARSTDIKELDLSMRQALNLAFGPDGAVCAAQASHFFAQCGWP